RGPGFDGGNGRMRGNAQQLMEKYLAMARDATSAGDRVLAENYFQHADHYYRVLNARFEQQQQNGQQRRFEGGQQNFDRQGGNPQGGYQGGHQGGGHQGGHQGGYNQNYGPNDGQDRPYEGDQQPRFDQPVRQHPEPVAQVQQPMPQRQPEPQLAAQNRAENEIGLPPSILSVA